MRLALIGFGNVGKALQRILYDKRSVYPFRIVGIHTLRQGTAYAPNGIAGSPLFGPPAESVDEFLDRCRPEIAIEVTTLDPVRGEPATTHIRAAFARSIHVVTANKGPIAHAFSALCQEARQAQVEFRFESTVMDGAPVFNTFRNNLPAVRVLGFTGVLNSTSKIVIETMQRGGSMAEGIAKAQAEGIAEADPSYDLDGWDSAAKTAALANVLMDAHTTPQAVERTGISQLGPDEVRRYSAEGRTVMLVSRGVHDAGGIRLQVKPEVLPCTDMLATAKGTSNLLLFHTDLMGTIGTVSITPTVEQTAYGVFADVVDIARSL